MRIGEYLRDFPQFSGVIVDGPNYKWEIAPGSRDDLFEHQCMCDHCEQAAAEMGLDLSGLKAGLDRFKSSMQGLTEDKALGFLATTDGFFGAADWWLSHPDLLDMLRYRYATVERHLRDVYTGIKERFPDLEVGSGSRTPAYASLTGKSLRRHQTLSDFQLPKLYYWPGNEPGFRYTVPAYVNTLTQWNPDLAEDTVVKLVERLLGIVVPDDYPVSRFNGPAPESFYREIAGQEMRKMIAMVDDPATLAPFVGAGALWWPTANGRRVAAYPC